MIKTATRTGAAAIARVKTFEHDRYRPGMCLYFQLVEIFGIPGVGDYDRNGRANCADYWKKASKYGRVVKATSWSRIPAGALCIWSGGSRGDGHAAIHIGGGKIGGTDQPTYGRVGIVPGDRIRSDWGLKLLGYVVVDGNGYTITPAPAQSKALGWYHVTAVALWGRSGPSTKTRGKYLRKRGHKLYISHTEEGDGRTWAVTNHGTHYALDYLQKGKK